MVCGRVIAVSPYEILEHTADIGLLARGRTLTEVFREATIGMLKIAGSFHPGHPGDGERVPIEVQARDLAGTLVDWLSEALYIQDSKGLSVGDVEVEAVAEESATGSVVVRPFAGDHSEGVQIKAVTYHQLSVEPAGDGWEARVFFDI